MKAVVCKCHCHCCNARQHNDQASQDQPIWLPPNGKAACGKASNDISARHDCKIKAVTRWAGSHQFNHHVRCAREECVVRRIVEAARKSIPPERTRSKKTAILVCEPSSRAFRVLFVVCLKQEPSGEQ